MDTTLSVAKTLKGITLNLVGPPTIVILKAQFDNRTEYHIERFESAKVKVIPYPSDLFKLGSIKSTVLALQKDTGTGCDERVCRECASNGVYECEHVPTGTWVLGKEKDKSQKPSKSMDELGYGSAELSQG
ncbi:MAG TPA: hypothetical protein VKR58_09510 [Aquella sp.]|nr:hypothetical protein [Aquella sp.]